MAQNLLILSLFLALGNAAASGASNNEKVVKLFNSGNELKIFGYYDKNSDGTLSTDEQEQFLDDVQKFSGVHLSASELSKVKTSTPMTVEKFDSTYQKVAKEVQQAQQRIKEERYQKEMKKREKAEELQNLFQSGNVEKIFAHYDQNSTGTLSLAEQDQFLDDVQELYGIHLPASFRSQCKTSSPMTPQQFQSAFTKMSAEFQTLQKKAQQDQQKAQLKRELAGMNPAQQQQLAKEYGIQLGKKHANSSYTPASQSSEPADREEEMLAYDAQQASGIYTDIAVFLVAAVTSAVSTTFVIHLYRKLSAAPKRDSYMMLSA